MDFLSIFPDHVLELIFSNLRKEKILPSTSRNRGDLIKATLISPKANEIISKSANLMKNTRFKLGEEPEWPNTEESEDSESEFLGLWFQFGCENLQITRKYVQIDFWGLEFFSTFNRMPNNLTQLTFNECNVEASQLRDFLSRNSETLELLIFSCGWIQDNGYCFVPLQRQIEHRLQLPKLRTLILTGLKPLTEMILLLIIRTTNLIELGLVRYTNDTNVEPTEATMFVDLIKANPNLETLHIPAGASELFLTYAQENAVDFKLEDLSLEFKDFHTQDNVNHCDIFLDFLETQKNSLKILKISNCSIEEAHFVRLLSLNLTRLEIHRSNIQMTRTLENSTIEVLALIRINFMPDFSNPGAVINLVNSCKNLAAFDASIGPEFNFSLSWQSFNSYGFKSFSWSDLRSLNYAGLICGTENMMTRPYLSFHRKLFKELSVDKHPNSLIEICYNCCK